MPNYKISKSQIDQQIGSHTFFVKWEVCSIRLPSCGILHRMGNAWVSHQFPKGLEIA